MSRLAPLAQGAGRNRPRSASASSARSRTSSCSRCCRCACRRRRSCSRRAPAGIAGAVELARGQPRRRGAAHPAEDRARQRGRPARAALRPRDGVRPLPRLGDATSLVDAALFAGLGWYTGNAPSPRSSGFVALTPSSASTSTSSGSIARSTAKPRRRCPRRKAGRPDCCDASTRSRTRRRIALVERFVEWRLRDAPAEARLAYHDSRDRLRCSRTWECRRSSPCSASASRSGSRFVFVWITHRGARRRRRARAAPRASCSAASHHQPEEALSNIVELADTMGGGRAAARSRRRTGSATSATSRRSSPALGMDLDTPGTRDTPRRFLAGDVRRDRGLRRRREAAHRVPVRAARARRRRTTARSSKARSRSSRSASTTRCRSTASRTSRTSPAARSSASRS